MSIQNDTTRSQGGEVSASFILQVPSARMGNSVEALHTGKPPVPPSAQIIVFRDLKEPRGGSGFAMGNHEARFHKIDERMDISDQRVDVLYDGMATLTGEMAALAGKVTALVDAQIRTEFQVAKLENAFVTLAELAKSTDERRDRSDRRVNGIEGEMATLTDKMSALVDAHIRTEVHVARLENAFVMFSELAKSMDERLDSSDWRADALHEGMSALTGKVAALVDAQIRTEALTDKMSALVDAQIRTEAHVARLENAIVGFAEFAQSMDGRMDSSDRRADALHEEITALTGKMVALVDAQIRTEAHVARLDNAIVRFAEFAQSMDERMDSSDRRADALHEEMAALTGKMAALVDAQILSETKFVELRQAQTRTDDRLNALINIVDRHVNGSGHEHSS
ncbi:MAG TPA: hypothetical protein VGV87_28035 [Blastocatellia bacterium]|nr:hypothetical protein [Blastocatellia bacterium]